MISHQRLFIVFVTLSFISGGVAFSQAIHYDSGYSWRAYTGTVAPICAEKLCHHYPMLNWDSYYTEFTAWKSENDIAGSAHAFMNFRVIFPPGYDIKDNSKKYPLIIMLHGSGESGRMWTGNFDYADTDPRYDNNGDQLRYGGNEHRIAVAKPASDSKSYPGIVVFPQSSYNSTWGGPGSNTINEHEELLIGFIESQLVNRYHADINRMVMHGISNGAKGLWALAEKRPDLFAAILPMSGVPYDNGPASTALATTPVWLFQGGQDINPTPQAAQELAEALAAEGNMIKITIYPTIAHPVWDSAFNEPDFFPWILAQDKRKIYVFAETPELCTGDLLRLGFSANMSGYQWTKDGNNISNATGRYREVGEPGKYTVKYQRPNGEWDESFPVDVTMRSTCEQIVTGLGPDENRAALRIYPNPAKDKIVLASRDPFLLSSIHITSVLGKPVRLPMMRLDDGRVEIDLTALSHGLYLIRMNGSRQVVRVVKKM